MGAAVEPPSILQKRKVNVFSPKILVQNVETPDEETHTNSTKRQKLDDQAVYQVKELFRTEKVQRVEEVSAATETDMTLTNFYKK